MPASTSDGAYDLGMDSFDIVKSVMHSMIPSVIVIAMFGGCKNDKTPEEVTITPDQRHSAIDSAMSLLDAGRNSDALAITTNLVLKDHSSPESQESHALVLIAYADQLERDGEVDLANRSRFDALKAYKTACKESSEPGLLLLSTAQLAQMLGDSSSINYYKQAHEQVPSDPRASFFIAQKYMFDEDWVNAKHWIDQCLTRNPNEPFALLSSGLIEAHLGNYKIAKQLATKGCLIFPEDHSLRFIQARIMRLSGQPNFALEIISSLPILYQNKPLIIEERNLCFIDIESKPHQ
jgi:tetratricopeptide (TPR) repeat protein